MDNQWLSKYNDDESCLLSSFRRGDANALEYLIGKFGRPLYFYISAITRDDNYAHDIMQNCFVLLWDRRSSFDTALSVRVFLYKVAHNMSLDHLKHNRIVNRHKTALKIEISEDFLDEKMIEEELIGRLHNAVDRLPAEMAKVFRLSLGGSKNPQIAEKLGISVNTVKTHKQRAKKMLRELLGNGVLFTIVSAL